MGLTVETAEKGERTRLTTVESIQDGVDGKDLYITTTSDDRAWYCIVLKTVYNFMSYLTIITVGELYLFSY